MAVIQPLYFAGGRYTPGTDRKLMASMVSSVNGARVEGVIPSNVGTDSMKVVPSSGRTIKIQTGLCVINDLATENTKTPGVYLAGVDTVEETLDLTPNSSGSTKYDHIYAQVDETAYVITAKALNGTTNIATITTSTAHGFSAGETVVITGVDDIFDGTHVIVASPAPTTSAPYQFSFARTHSTISSTSVSACVIEGTTVNLVNNKTLSAGTATLGMATTTGLTTGDIVTVKGVDSTFDGTYQITVSGSNITYKINKVTDDVSSTAVASSSVAKARVPFRIKAEELSSATYSAPTGAGVKGILLAIVTKTNGYTTITSGNIADARTFVSTQGGVHYYYSASDPSVYPTGTAGRLRYDLTNNVLELYTGAAWSQISLLNHTHDTRYRKAVTTDGSTMTTPLGASYTSGAGGQAVNFGTATSLGTPVSFTCNVDSYALVTVSVDGIASTIDSIGAVYAAGTGATTFPAASGTNSRTATDGTATLDATFGRYDANSASGVRQNAVTHLVKFTAGTTSVQLTGTQLNDSTVVSIPSNDAKIYSATLSIVPLYTVA